MNEQRLGQYQELLFEIAWKSGRTLDLDTICEQAVTDLGRGLGASRCIIGLYQEASGTITVIAEYRQEQYRSMLGLELAAVELQDIEAAIATGEPVTTDKFPDDDRFDRQSQLLGATLYQNKPNGLICLHHCQSPYQWSEAEITLMRELGEKLGVAIAHAALYQQSQEALAKAEAASRLKTQWLSHSSYELRTILNNMMGGLQLLRSGMADNPDEQGELLHFAYLGSQNLMKIIQESLDFAQLEAGQLNLYLEPISLRELFRDIDKSTRSEIERKNLSFDIKQPTPAEDILLYSNYQRLRQVLLKLIDNAIKFTSYGGITLSAEQVLEEAIVNNRKFSSMVKICVSDTGVGVPLHRQDQLFQPPERVPGNGSLPSSYRGFQGWGLIISKQLVEAMGGKLSFYSEGTECGSTVSFTIPLY
ncbi:MAG: GAF domain-containing protein [Oscillatoria sp. SIO1A7]|nr:GAF domain-containing protein [Oscillatoria sp. SIO1A7]